MNEFTPLLIILVGLFLFYGLIRTFRILKEYERAVIFFLGRYGGTRGPGFVFVIPLIETAIKVDIREKFLDIPSQTAITQDNAPIAIDFLVYYRVIEPKLSVIAVEDVVSASTNIATTTLRAVIGDITLDDVLSKREQINDTLRVKLDEVTERWGLKVTSVEIREIEPPRDVQDAMNRQMTAERERRAAVTRASGEREAAITVAEGDKQSAVLRAEGMKQSSILQAEGERQAQLLRAQGFAASIEAIDNQARGIGVNTMTLQYLQTLREVGSSPATKFILPMELTTMAHQVLNSMTTDSSGNGNKNAKPVQSGD